ncbi:YlaH-like family protein [Paenibacillus sp.]|uniref:YlaH-like family protein n=1 Tax=Paenibacillus sp. TaxID=58172 RepID=UPI002D36F597|nr:YlaH-like family protein [Paenibacillus sp.]HZG88293.1 YlaH-like family protein [Paenibacillus sp.]
MNEWFFEHVWITYALIYALVTYVYNKVFRVRKLPLLKDAIIYLLIGVGSFILLIFQMFGLPIILSLSVAVGLMLLVRVRYFVEGRAKRKAQRDAEGRANGEA